MTVYLDMVFALNYLVNYALLRGTARLGAAGARRNRLALGAGTGAAYATAIYLPNGGWLRLTPMKLICAAVMLLVAFGWRRSTLRLGAVFALLTLVLCGAVYGLELLKNGEVRRRGSDFFYPVTFSSVVLTAGGVGAACRLLLPRLEHAPNGTVPLTLHLAGRRLHLTALRDSGNTLCDPVTGEPVLVAHWTAARALLPSGLQLRREDFAAPDDLALRLRAHKPRLIPFRAVGTSAGLLLAISCQISLEKRSKIALVAFSPTPVSDGGAYEALIGGNLYAEIAHTTAVSSLAKTVQNHVHRRQRHSPATPARRRRTGTAVALRTGRRDGETTPH